ncbi:MAG: DUF5686 and carboxypeptidase regulatory-like domain-containing protein [Tannerellaceae bacterium]|jgi:hypothetical protein|nr:DUF5686 and carboxypeptidase regulatory-like domain-containing protein [Tannerellaceae bacterium]
MLGRKILGFLVGLWLTSGYMSAETVKGIVKDSLTGEALAFVSVVFEGGAEGHEKQGGITDVEGYFSLPNKAGASYVSASFLGYETKRERITGEELTVMLKPVAFELKEVTVKPKRERYSRHDNPAIDLAHQVIAHKGENRIEAKAGYSVQVYEKLSLAWDDFQPNLDKGFMKRFAFVKNYTDTSALTGQPILTLSMRETLSEKYYRRSPETSRIIVKGRRQEGVDETIDQNGTLSANIQEIFRPVNIFENNITILLSRFVSPLNTAIGLSYYHFYIIDTTEVEGNRCATLAFVPANSEGYGFTGKMSVTLDGRFAVKKLILNLSHKANINWVDQLRIEQAFRQGEDSTWVVSEENTYISFLATKSVPRIYAHQVRSYDGYDFNPDADSVFALSGDMHILPLAEAQTDTFWRQARPFPLREREDILSSLLKELQGVPIFNVLIKTGEILISGYIPTRADQSRSVFDFGPVNTALSGNSVEGLRFRAGGMTTAQLHPRLFAAGYLAYGLNDRRFKYQTNLTYSFNPKKVHVKESPIHALSFLCEYDIYTLGQDFLYTSKDNLFVSPPGMSKDSAKMQYIRKTALSYEREFPSGFSFKTWLQRSNNEAAGTLYYKPLNDFDIQAFTTTETGLTLRYAPNEPAFNSRRGRDSRLNLSSKDIPILTLSHYMGIKGLFGGKYSYHHTEVSAEKRIWFSSFGHLDAKVKAGGIWNTVPFPLLILPNANQSFTIQPEAFNLMRPVEFVSDRYVSLYATYYLKGWILNRIPIINRLKFREVVSVNAFWGTLSALNNPENPLLSGSSRLFDFPEDTRPLGKLPYVEASVGVENIFKCLRLDYYRRLTYLDAHEGAASLRKGAIRLALRFTF